MNKLNVVFLSRLHLWRPENILSNTVFSCFHTVPVIVLDYCNVSADQLRLRYPRNGAKPMK